MIDIEKALKKIQSSSSSPNTQVTQDAEIEQLAPPIPPQGHGLSGLAPPATNSLNDIPLLNANFEAFRNGVGGAEKHAHNIDGAFRVLRTQVLEAMKVRGARVLGVTSAGPDAGKTVTSINLALACARREEQGVFLADFDYRRPSIAKYLQATDFPSSIGFFQGAGDLSQYFRRTSQGNLRFLLTDSPTEMSAEYLASSKMDDALAQMTRAPNAIVIADLPPMIGCDDTHAMMSKLDGVILVIPSGSAPYHAIERVVAQIPSEKLVATVLNKVAASDAQYHYNY